MLLINVSSQALAASAPIRSGHSGHWYDPARDGEGFVLEMFEDERAALYWYTYDDQGRQRWLFALGQIAQDAAGHYLDFPSLLVTRGGRFGLEFDPTQVEREEVGSARLRFADCNRAEFAGDAFGQVMQLSLQRLAHATGLHCESRNGALVREIGEQAGLSGSWFDPGRDGEGYTLQWMDPGTALLTWYSYDRDGEQAWMVGVGTLDAEGRLQFPELQATRGARFGAAFSAQDVERYRWGALSLHLECGTGRADYRSVLPSFGEGSQTLQRLTQPRGLACPYRPSKLTDLYDIEFSELPIADQARGFFLRGITDSGVVVLVPGGSGNRVRRYVLAEDRWEDLISPYPEVGVSVRDAMIFPASDTLLAGQHTWSAETGWEPIDAPAGYPSWFAINSTRDMSIRVGRGFRGDSGLSTAEEIASWIWNAERGYVELPRVEERFAGDPVCVSDEAKVVGGFLFRSVPGRPARRGAIAWLDREEAVSVRDPLGSELSIVTHCTPGGVILGADQTIPEATHPNSRQAWWWQAPGVSGYLGDAPDVLSAGVFVYQVMHASEDGSLVVGFYRTQRPGLSTDGFIWTRATGMVSVADLLEDLGISLPWTWVGQLEMSARATNSRGDRILVEASHFDGQDRRIHGAVLSLRPHSADW